MNPRDAFSFLGLMGKGRSGRTKYLKASQKQTVNHAKGIIHVLLIIIITIIIKIYSHRLLVFLSKWELLVK